MCVFDLARFIRCFCLAIILFNNKKSTLFPHYAVNFLIIFVLVFFFFVVVVVAFVLTRISFTGWHNHGFVVFFFRSFFLFSVQFSHYLRHNEWLSLLYYLCMFLLDDEKMFDLLTRCSCWMFVFSFHMIYFVAIVLSLTTVTFDDCKNYHNRSIW